MGICTDNPISPEYWSSDEENGFPSTVSSDQITPG